MSNNIDWYGRFSKAKKIQIIEWLKKLLYDDYIPIKNKYELQEAIKYLIKKWEG